MNLSLNKRKVNYLTANRDFADLILVIIYTERALKDVPLRK